jgi:hypothetical protein
MNDAETAIPTTDLRPDGIPSNLRGLVVLVLSIRYGAQAWRSKQQQLVAWCVHVEKQSHVTLMMVKGIKINYMSTCSQGVSLV